MGFEDAGIREGNPFQDFATEAENWLQNINEGQGMKGWSAIDSDHIRGNWPNNFLAAMKSSLRRLPSYKALSEDESLRQMAENALNSQADLAMSAYQQWRRSQEKK